MEDIQNSRWPIGKASQVLATGDFKEPVEKGNQKVTCVFPELAEDRLYETLCDFSSIVINCPLKQCIKDLKEKFPRKQCLDCCQEIFYSDDKAVL